MFTTFKTTVIFCTIKKHTKKKISGSLIRLHLNTNSFTKYLLKVDKNNCVWKVMKIFGVDSIAIYTKYLKLTLGNSYGCLQNVNIFFLILKQLRTFCTEIQINYFTSVRHHLRKNENLDYEPKKNRSV